jgi:RNA polymerase sigma factor (sigma-70 family)
MEIHAQPEKAGSLTNSQYDGTTASAPSHASVTAGVAPDANFPNCAEHGVKQPRKRITWLGADPTLQKRLRSIVAGLERNWHNREDLFQESLLHLWREENLHPQQTLSWFLQSCCFHLRHFKAAGRSLDSPKRRWGRSAFLLEWEDDNDYARPPEFISQDAMAEISARDFIESLERLLGPREKAVLDLCLQGFSTREIGRRLSISLGTVSKSRQKTMSLAAGFVKVENDGQR